MSYTVTFGSQVISGTPDYYSYGFTASPGLCCGGYEQAGIENSAYDYPYNHYDENFAYVEGLSGYPGFVSGAGSYGSGLTYTEDYNVNTGVYSSYGAVEADITYVSVSGTPEPSTWAMMALGFAGLGFAGLRHARRAAVL